MKIALINTMDGHGRIVGSILSTHRTREAAEREDASIQRAVKRHNGQSSYLPTIIREVNPKAKKGMSVQESWIVD